MTWSSVMSLGISLLTKKVPNFFLAINRYNVAEFDYNYNQPVVRPMERNFWRSGIHRSHG
jgi:hypothetical protein